VVWRDAGVISPWLLASNRPPSARGRFFALGALDEGVLYCHVFRVLRRLGITRPVPMGRHDRDHAQHHPSDPVTVSDTAGDVKGLKAAGSVEVNAGPGPCAGQCGLSSAIQVFSLSTSA
jgi:hypothetical protein